MNLGRNSVAPAEEMDCIPVLYTSKSFMQTAQGDLCCHARSGSGLPGNTQAIEQVSHGLLLDNVTRQYWQLRTSPDTCLTFGWVLCRQVQKAVEEAQADAMERAAASSSGGPAQLTVGKAMEASKEAAARLAAKGLSQPSSSDPADGPSRSAGPICCPLCLSKLCPLSAAGPCCYESWHVFVVHFVMHGQGVSHVASEAQACCWRMVHTQVCVAMEQHRIQVVQLG